MNSPAERESGDESPAVGLLSSETIGSDHPGLAPATGVVARWWSNKPSDGLPPRSVFPAEGWGELFGRISVLEPVDDGADFRYRLHAGTAATLARLDLTGRLLSEMPYADYAAELICQAQTVFRSGVPGFHRMRIRWLGQEYDYVRVALPVAADGGGVQLLSVILHTDPDKPRYRSRFVSAAAEPEPDSS